jgi:hypothetical protein
MELDAYSWIPAFLSISDERAAASGELGAAWLFGAILAHETKRMARAVSKLPALIGLHGSMVRLLYPDRVECATAMAARPLYSDGLD